MSAVMGQTGASFEQGLGMLTAITEVTRSASKASRGLVSIGSRLVEVLNENSSTGNNLRKIYEELGIQLFDTQGQLRSSYDIFYDLAQIWDTLDRNTQNYISTEQAGTTQFQNFAALMKNFSTAVEASEVAMNSAGSAANENARYMEGLEAKTQGVKAKFEQLANAVVDSDLVKNLLDIAGALLEIANTPLGTFVTQASLLTGILWGGTGLIKAMKIIPNMLSGIAGGISAVGKATKLSFPILAALGLALTAIISLSPKIVDWFKRQTDEEYKATENLKNLNKSLDDNQARLEELYSIPQMNRTDAINDEIKALEDENKKLKENIQLQEESAKSGKLTNLVSKPHQVASDSYIAEKYGEQAFITSDIGNFIPANSAEKALDQLVKYGYVVQEEVDKVLQEVNNDAEKALEKLGFVVKHSMETLAGEDYYKQVMSNMTRIIQEYQRTGTLSPELINSYIEYKGILDELIETTADLTDEQLRNEGLDWVVKTKNNLKGFPEVNNAIISSNYDVNESLALLNEGYALNKLQVEQLDSAFPGLSQALEETDQGFKSNTNSLSELLNKLGESNEEVKSLSGSYDRLIKGMGLSTDEVLGLKKVIPGLTSVVKRQNDAWYIEIKALVNSAKAGNEWAIAMIADQKGVTIATIKNINARVKAMEKEYQAFLSSGAARGNAMTGAKYQAKLNELKRIQNEVLGIGGFDGGLLIGSPDISLSSPEDTTTSTGGSSKAKDPALERFNEAHKALQHKLNMDLISQEEYYNELEKLIEEYKNSANANEQEMYQYEEEIYKGRKKLAEDLAKAQANALKESLEKQKAQMQDALGYIIGQFNKEIDALESRKQSISDYYDEQIDALTKQNEELNRQIELEEALDNLARAKQTKVRVFKNGKFQYAQDIDKVSSAQGALSQTRREQEYQRNREALERQKEIALDALDTQIQYWQSLKSNWENILDNYEENQDKLIAQEVFGINFEQEGWEKRLGNASAFAEQYQNIANRIAEVASQLQNSLNSINASMLEMSSLNSGGLSVASTYSGWSSLQTTPDKLVSTYTGGRSMGDNVGITIQNFNPNLSNVSDGEGFANYMRNNFYRETLQMA